MVKCLNIGKNIGKPIYRSCSIKNTVKLLFLEILMQFKVTILYFNIFKKVKFACMHTYTALKLKVLFDSTVTQVTV